jgi:hypothetical protein
VLHTRTFHGQDQEPSRMSELAETSPALEGLRTWKRGNLHLGRKMPSPVSAHPIARLHVNVDQRHLAYGLCWGPCMSGSSQVV